ncbi:MAG: S-layer homology domain-containing protein, partial [Firmicutes bacterium]|nr:S-layer homology domain-containing protein [Bacillota bacterium]
RAIGGTLEIRKTDAHGYAVKTGADLDNLTVYAEKAAGETFGPESLSASVVKTSMTHSMTKTEAKEPTCTEDGNSAYWTCSVCGKFFSDENGKNEIEKDSWVIEATGHSLTKTEAKQPTCTEAGNSEYWTCDLCGKFFSDENGTTEIEKDSWLISATGHTPGEWEYDSNRHWRSCTVCEVELEQGDHTFSGNTCTVCGFTKEIPFVDVPSDAYYFDAVLWTVENGITNGTSATTFSPDESCTRAQAITFLWRAAGCPSPQSREMPFKDVDKGSYYETAVLWAVENGITKGTSATTFSPEDNCTRAQIAAFLWRSQGMPDAGTSNPFTDVTSGKYYYNAVLWAVENGITNGTSATTFSPDEDCARDQIVTFLYRCLSK